MDRPAPIRVHGWRRDGARLVRELQFRDFEEAVRFLEDVAVAASDHGRRPDMCVFAYNRVRLAVANPNGAPLTRAEERLAAKVDELIERTHSHAVT
jgi:4a-hydroxytetrahydrobiopterin dehydratase